MPLVLKDRSDFVVKEMKVPRGNKKNKNKREEKRKPLKGFGMTNKQFKKSNERPDLYNKR